MMWLDLCDKEPHDNRVLLNYEAILSSSLTFLRLNTQSLFLSVFEASVYSLVIPINRPWGPFSPMAGGKSWEDPNSRTTLDSLRGSSCPNPESSTVTELKLMVHR